MFEFKWIDEELQRSIMESRGNKVKGLLEETIEDLLDELKSLYEYQVENIHG